jgi:upstream activation factor subunit UAF30
LLHVGILSMLSSMAFDGEMKDYSGVIFLTGGITIMATKKKPAKKPAAKKSAAKKAPKKAAPKKKSGAKRKPSAAFMKPWTPSAALAAVVGSAPIPRTEIISKMWVYIKKHNLQDPKNKRSILADDKLKAVFGGKKQVDMFEMPGLISKNLK